MFSAFGTETHKRFVQAGRGKEIGKKKILKINGNHSFAVTNKKRCRTSDGDIFRLSFAPSTETRPPLRCLIPSDGCQGAACVIIPSIIALGARLCLLGCVRACVRVRISRTLANVAVFVFVLLEHFPPRPRPEKNDAYPNRAHVSAFRGHGVGEHDLAPLPRAQRVNPYEPDTISTLGAATCARNPDRPFRYRRARAPSVCEQQNVRLPPPPPLRYNCTALGVINAPLDRPLVSALPISKPVPSRMRLSLRTVTVYPPPVSGNEPEIRFSKTRSFFAPRQVLTCTAHGRQFWMNR